MTEPITLEKITLSGFRAYLEPKDFTLCDDDGPLNLAVFAPNGKGKSSLVDSLEYYFDKDGTLEILGRNSTGTRGGINALRNVDADKYGKDTYVHVWFKQGGETFDDSRPIFAPLTKSARRVIDLTKVPFVIRGHKLRWFVNGEKQVDRYKELVTWLDLDPLFDVQENLRILKRRMADMVADTSDVDERTQDITHVTSGSVSSYDEQAILDWLNGNVLAALDESLQLVSLSDGDPAFLELKRREEAEQKRSGLGVLSSLLAAIDDLHKPPGTPQETSAGRIPSFEAAVSKFKDATANAETAQAATSGSEFSNVWQSAKLLLERKTELGKCPVCDTEFASSRLGTRENVYANLLTNIATLKQYIEAEAARKNAEDDLIRIKRELEEALKLIFHMFGSEYQHGAVDDYRETLKSWKVGEGDPSSMSAADELARLRSTVNADITSIERQQGEHTYDGALTKVRSLLYTKAEMERIRRTKAAQAAIQESLRRQANAVDGAIVKHIRNLLEALQSETSVLYKRIQGRYARVPQIHIKLADEGSANQRSAQLLIDFADNRRGVAPGGFLSDSQIHTLALALRLAAIRIFNSGVKIIALDDIVTSYDVDRRKNIAAVLGAYFGDFQVIIVTHDEAFFETLHGQLQQDRWQFKRIKELRDGIGPIFNDHKTKDERVDAKLANGEDAGNDMRIIEEEWLTRICYEFRTPTDFHREKHTNSMLAASLGKFLKKKNLEPPKVPGNANPFILSLQASTTENLSSHFNDNAYKSASIGDMQYRWDEFKYFRSLFVCPECNRSRFVRPHGFPKPVCTKCRTEFSFEHQTPLAS